MKKRALILLLALTAWAAYTFRRHILARLLKLPPPDFAVDVDRGIPVTMPDGVRLYTDHYYPNGEGPFPTILIRTPYGRGQEAALFGGYPLSEMPAQRFAERGYHVILQGARGCLDSEGTFSSHVNEAADGQATVRWIEEQPWFNGVLGTWGPSYLGYMQWAIAAGNLDSLKAMVPIVTSAENFTVTHPDGAFGLETRLRWAQGMYVMNKLHGRPLKETFINRFFGDQEDRLQEAFDTSPLRLVDEAAVGEPMAIFRDILNHTEEADPFWIARDHSQAVSTVTAAVHLIGGWYDYYLRGIIRDYTALKAVGQSPYLTIGPWNHANPGGMMTGLREGITWFDSQLKGADSGLRSKPVRLFIMGMEEWREFEEFPPPGEETYYYLQSDSKLTEDPPAADSLPDTYRYDPEDPTPSIGGAILGSENAGAQDNRELEARSDVLIYSSEPLDQAVQIIGPVTLDLYVQSSLEHTDFFGRLCDVNEEGISTNICDGLMRVAPWRGDRQDDGTLYLKIEFWPTAYYFQSGHRLRLQVSSGAHPRWSRNLGLGDDLANGKVSAVAEQTIYHDDAHPSVLTLRVVNSA